MASYSEEIYTCVGPYSFSNEVSQNELVEFVVARKPNGAHISLMAGTSILYSSRGDSIVETASQIKGTKNAGDRVLILFDKNKNTLLLVVKHINGVNKFEGKCY